jgi:hypothetical protein
MTYKYTLVRDPITNTEDSLKRQDEDGNVAIVPVTEDNRDYQEYLEWLAEGNEPLPADES